MQYALDGDVLYVLEANPRASRTVPFVSKATAVQLAKAAARIAVGATIAELRDGGRAARRRATAATCPTDAPIAVKEAVLPFHRFRTVEGDGVDTVLGPEMKSTGEVMGFDAEFGTAFAKSQAAAYGSLPTEGTVFVSLANRDKRAAIFPVKRLADLGFRVLATAGTAQVLRRNGVHAEVVGKFSDGPGNVRREDPGRRGRPRRQHAVRLAGQQRARGWTATRSVPPRWRAGIPCMTTVQGMAAAVQGIEELRRGDIGVRSLQDVQPRAAGHAGPARERPLTSPVPRAASPPVQRVVEVVGRRAGQRLRRAHAGRAGDRRARRARPVRRRSRSAGETSAMLLRRSIAISAAPTTASVTVRRGRRTARARPGWPRCARRHGSTSSARWAGRSRCRSPAPGRCWSAAATAPRRWSALAARGCGERGSPRRRGHRRGVGRPAVLGRGARQASRRRWPSPPTTAGRPAGPGHRRASPS